MVHLENSWDDLLSQEFQLPYYQKLRAFLKAEYATKRIFPPMNDIFNALRYTTYENMKVVLLGQDPYHGEGQAHGLSFSVKKGVKIPPSLQNIYKELRDDIGMPFPSHGDLTSWAKQGVLLLNATLTVREGQAASHKGYGWETLTDAIIRIANDCERPLVFILWGGNARMKRSLITNPHHCIIQSPHPSPLSAYAGFFGSKPFSKTNEFLIKTGRSPIHWESVLSN